MFGIWFLLEDVVFTEQPFVIRFAAATVHAGEPEIFFEGLVFSWLPAAPCAALAARPASPEVWSYSSPSAMPAACFIAYVYVFIGALVAFTVEVTPVAYVTVRMSSTVGVATINGALWDLGSFQSIDGSI